MMGFSCKLGSRTHLPTPHPPAHPHPQLSLDAAMRAVGSPAVMVLIKDFVLLVCDALEACSFSAVPVEVSPGLGV